MGKQIRKKKKKQVTAKPGDSNVKESKVVVNIPKACDEDMEVFISMSRGLKDEGNKLFQKRAYEGAMLNYEKAMKLLPKNHIDVSYLRSNMAACYMQIGLSEYPRAIHECNLALEVTPKYSKALLKRARCYEALNRLDLALRDVNTVLNMEPNNIMATEIAERMRTTVEKKGIKADDIPIDLVPENFEPPCFLPPSPKVLKEKLRKKKNKKFEEKKFEDETEKEVEAKVEKKAAEEKTHEKKAEDKVEERKAEEKTDEKKSEDKVEEKKAEEKTHGKKVEDKVEETKAEEKTNEKKSEDKVETNAKEKTHEKKSEDKVEERKAKEKTHVKKSEDKVEETNAEEKTHEKKSEDKVERKAEEKTHVKKSEEKVEETKAEEKTDEKKAEDKVEETRAKERTDEKKAEDKVHETRAEEKTDEKKKKDRVEERRAEEKTGEKKAGYKVEEMTAEEKTVEEKAEEKVEETKAEEKADEKKAEDKIEDKKAEDKLVVEEKISNVIEEVPKRNVKLVFGDDIRWAQLPFNCSVLKVREVICDRFPSSKAVLVKYRDQEGDLVTITSNEELRWAEACAEQQGSLRLYIVEVNPAKDPFYAKLKREEEVVHKPDIKHNNITENGSIDKGKRTEMGPACIDDWIIQFAQLFKNYVGFNSDSYLDLHELGMKLYSEAMEETVTSEEAQDLFNTAAEKFQEMAALALFNWGNVHMSRARKRVYFTEDASRESIIAQVETAYDWAQKEYLKAGKRYEEALIIKPDFYEGILALGKQLFEQAKLSWYYAVGTNVNLVTWPFTDVLQLYNDAEDYMEKGMQMWEEAEEQRLTDLSKPNKVKILMQKMGLAGLYKDISAEEGAEQAANMRNQINLLWGTMLYERSIMEFKLGLPVWQECLEVAIEKFELAGASPTDIAVMIKNHCSNDSAVEGLGFNIDEIVQAWNEMYEAKRWQSDVPSFRLEPLLRRRVSKLYHVLA